jgi:hypothetical protein
MTIRYALFAAMLCATSTFALPSFPVTFQDAVDSDVPSDVIGNPAQFEIYTLTLNGITGDTLRVDIRFNYGGGANFSPFNINGFAPTLHVGDLFFHTPTADYAFILNGHNGLVTSGLYQITGTQSAQTVLGNPSSGTYRNSAPVWASPTGATLLSTGSSSVSTVDNVATSLLASLFIPLPAGVIETLENGFDIYFASATCGNDEIFGTVLGEPGGDPPGDPVPEPATLMTMGAGLVLAGLLRRKA